MVYRFLADAVMLIHFGFLAFVALGGFVARRYRWVLVPHVAAVGWGALTVTVGLDCPLTGWENTLRRLGDEDGLPRGFIDTYLTGVVYPQEYLPAAQLLVATLVVVSWVALAVAPRRSDFRRVAHCRRTGAGYAGHQGTKSIQRIFSASMTTARKPSAHRDRPNRAP